MSRKNSEILQGELETHIALSLIPNAGAQRISTLLKGFDSPGEIFRASAEHLMRFPGIGKGIAEQIVSFRDWDEVKRIMERSESTGAKMILRSDDDYPERLRHIFDPPLLLWSLGNPEVLNHPGIAVIGTRKPGRYGAKMAGEFTEAISETGLSIVSGLAYGIDTIAHHKAVNLEKPTVGVLGSGIDWIYPASNKTLVRQMIDQGSAVITEFPPGTKPDAGNFPVRNRIVSGLSLGVLIVESAETGGSMITAKLALDQGREVFAVPHDILNEKGRGGNGLIKRGQAKLVQNMTDIIEELQLMYDLQALQISKGTGTISKKESAWKSKNPEGNALVICKLLEEESPMHIDKLAEKSQIPMHSLMSLLLQLELDGLLEPKSGRMFTIC